MAPWSNAFLTSLILHRKPPQKQEQDGAVVVAAAAAAVSAQQPRQPLSLRTLPHELQLMIIQNLAFADMERLRRTCRFYRTLITPDLVWTIFATDMRSTLLSHCYLCLRHDPSRAELLCPDQLDPRFPLASRCIDCAAQRDEFTVGCKYALGNFTSAWVCRWCGFPVQTDDAATQSSEFHFGCYARYNAAMLIFFLLGCVQACVAVVACALCWRMYGRNVPGIMGMCVVAFLLGIPSFVFTLARGRVSRTYHCSLIMEGAVLALWSGVAYLVVREQYLLPAEEAVRLSPVAWRATIAFIGLNMLFRLLNTLGNILLMFNPKLWRRRKPGLWFMHRVVWTLAMGLVVWTYPQAVQQDYPGSGMWCCPW